MLSVVMTLSCIRDSLDGCPQYLRFSYAYNMSGEDLFTREVTSVKVFVLNDDGTCMMTAEETDPVRLSDSLYRMELPYSVMCKRLVVWAGLDGGPYTVSSDCGAGLDPGSDRTVTPLWHSGPEKLLFDEAGRTQTVSLVRTTNTVKVALDGCDPKKVSMSISSDNCSYGPDHTPKKDGGKVWAPVATTEEGDTSIFKIMRLVEDSAATLRVSYDSRPITFGGQAGLDLVKYFLSSKPTGMTDQEYLDREHVWTVEVRLAGTAALSLTINGWTIWFQDQQL